MSKHNYFVKILKKINSFIDSLLEKNLNKLNFIFKKRRLIDIISPKKTIIFLGIIFFFSLLYLSTPYSYNKNQLSIKIKNYLLKKFELNFILSENLSYSLFPSPNFVFHNVSIVGKDKNFADNVKLKIYISVKNLFSYKNININSIFLEDANFNLNKKNLNFFIKFLKNDFLESSFEIRNSKFFFRNIENDVLFINKIHHIKYYYDSNELKNILDAKNEIFNILYSLKLQNDYANKNIFSIINFDHLKFNIENEIKFFDNKKVGLIKFFFNKNRSEANYQIYEDNFIFNFLSKSNNKKFNYKGKINFTPFYFDLIGETDGLNINKLFSIESLLTQFIKTEIFNNKNLYINTSIASKKILPFKDLNDLIIKVRIKEGLIDVDDTIFNWLDYAKFQISDSLVYVNNNNLVLDGKLSVDINDFNQIYKFLQTPRNYRLELKKINFNFNYNFDQQIFNFSEIIINGQANEKVNNILNQFISKNSLPQNRIYFKNLVNQAIKSYAG